MKVKLEETAFMPERAHKTDGGLDLKSMEDAVIYPGRSHTFDTGVHIQLPPGTAGILQPKSGLNVNHNLVSFGLIDEGFVGSIRVKLYNIGDEIYKVKRGDKISQLVILPIVKPKLELVDELEETERGDQGFGSTGR